MSLFLRLQTKENGWRNHVNSTDLHTDTKFEGSDVFPLFSLLKDIRLKMKQKLMKLRCILSGLRV